MLRNTTYLTERTIAICYTGLNPVSKPNKKTKVPGIKGTKWNNYDCIMYVLGFLSRFHLFINELNKTLEIFVKHPSFR